MKTFPLEIITPEKVFYTGNVQRIIVRTTEGDAGILAGHEKYVAALPAGPVRITLEDGTEKIAALSGGALRVSPQHTAVLANAAEWAEDIDVEWAKRSEADALRRREQSKTQTELDRAEAKLKRALNRLRVSGMK